MDADVAVVGGGPIGAALAMLLARGGRRVAVLERAAFPRDKPCGEALMPSGASVLAGLGVDLLREGFPPLSGVRYRLEGHGSVAGAFRTGRGFGVRRIRLDALLAERAAATPNVRFITDCTALGVRHARDHVGVETRLGELRARTLVAADGLRSPVARWLGWARPPDGRARHALVGHLAGVAPGNEIVVTLLGDVEVYAAPSGPDETLAVVLGGRGSLRHAGRSVAETYRTVVDGAHPEMRDGELRGPIRGAGPFRVAPATVAAGRVFLAGDATGFLDPLTGDGISAGLAQAAVLASLLAAGGADVADAGRRYRVWHRRQWRRRRVVTRLALGLTGSTALARRALAGVHRRPDALQALLEVNDGSRGLTGLRPRDWAALAGF